MFKDFYNDFLKAAVKASFGRMGGRFFDLGNPLNPLPRECLLIRREMNTSFVTRKINEEKRIFSGNGYCLIVN